MDLKAIQKPRWRLNQRKQVGVESSKGAGKHETNKKSFMWKIEIKF
jgi:hypothetical protein